LNLIIIFNISQSSIYRGLYFSDSRQTRLKLISLYKQLTSDKMLSLDNDDVGGKRLH